MDQALPEDVLADVLRRLPPRSLAATRCASKALRAIIDTRRLLRADLLPLSLGGIFINFNDLDLAEFFYPLAAGRPVSGDLTSTVDDHCNGLVLLSDSSVVNPATRRWAPLPPPPVRAATRRARTSPFFYTNGVKYLVFDPAVAAHYEVFLIPHVPPSKSELSPVPEKSEWPPSPLILPVFSSRTGIWEMRPFIREGGAAGIITHMLQPERHEKKHYGVYLRGALYVHCQNNFFYRISSSADKYQVIKPPAGIGSGHYPGLYLGKSKNKVHCASIHHGYDLRVWILDESLGRFEWRVKHRINLKLVMPPQDHHHHDHVDEEPWFLEDNNYYSSQDNTNEEAAAPVGEEEARRSSCYVDFLGFHPWEDVVFLSDTLTRGMAYHFDSFRVEYLGKLSPRSYGASMDYEKEELINASYPFTPCWTGELSGNN